MASSKSNTAIRRRLVSAWVSTVISLALVLLLVGMGTLLLVNARAVSNYFKENMQVSVLLKEYVNEEEAMQYESKVAALPGVRSASSPVKKAWRKCPACLARTSWTCLNRPRCPFP